MFFQFFIVILASLVGLASVAEIVWGGFLDEYHTFGQSFLSIIVFISGFYDPITLIDYDTAFALIFIILMFFIQLIIFIAVFSSIFAESLRRTVSEYGYPDDYSGDKWGIQQYKIWLLHFVDEPTSRAES